MLALRLARGSRPAVQFRRLLVTLASGGTGLLLLCALGYAMAHPQAHDSAVLRLAWCAVPLAATADLAVAVARADPGSRPRPGAFATGLGPGRLLGFSVLTTAAAGLVGSVLALLCFLVLRGDLAGLPLDGAASGLLAADRSLPAAAVVVLLGVAPLAACAATALVFRPRRSREQASDPDGFGRLRPAGRPGGLPWGVALLALGLAVQTHTGASDHPAHGPRLPEAAAGGSLGGLAGWALTAVGLALCGPAVAFACGWLLQTGRPGGLRLLAGRVMQQQARHVGRPLGVVCAVASGASVAGALAARDEPGAGPVVLLGAVVVAGCTLTTLLMAVLQARQARARSMALVRRLGAPAGLLRSAAALRAGALLAVFTPLAWAVAVLTALPAGG